MTGENLEKCCVCNKAQQSHSNRLLVCGNCAVVVHQGCYGAQKSVGIFSWFCRKCESQVRISKIRCDLCPIKEGAFKRSGGARCGWSHVLCAIYFPEAYFKDPESMDLIMLDCIPSDRYGRPCVFCERNQRSYQATQGACIQCSWTSCRTYFHVSCASIAGLLSELPDSVLESADSLAVALSKSSACHSASLMKSTEKSGVRLSTSLSCQSDEVIPLLGFCSARHKEKFADSLSQNSSIVVSQYNTDVQSSETAVSKPRCPSSPTTVRDVCLPTNSLKHSTPATLSEIDSGSETSATALCVASTNETSEEKLMSSTRTSDDSFLCADDYSETGSVKKRPNRESKASTGTEVCEPNSKYTKTEDTDQRTCDTGSLAIKSGTISAVDSNMQSPHSEFGAPKLESTAVTSSLLNSPNNEQSAVTLQTPLESGHGITSAASLESHSSTTPFIVDPSATHRSKKKPRNRREQKKTQNCNLKSSKAPVSSTHTNISTSSTLDARSQHNLVLTWPRRPLPLRGIGLPVKGEVDNTTTVEGDTATSSVNTSSPSNACLATSIQSPLATMQDLLEWQWDQAGALLMQQVDGTDVVSLLDCLHQLKSENDSLEAKLVRLKTRQEHLLSVNARLAASLATIEATTTSMPVDDSNRTTNRSIQSSKGLPQDEAQAYSQAAIYSQHAAQLSLRPGTPFPKSSPDQLNLTSRSLITAAPTFRPNLSPIAVYQGSDSSPVAVASSSSQVSMPGYHPQQSPLLPKSHQWSANRTGSVCSSPSTTAQISKSAHSTSRPKHIKKSEHRPTRKQLSNQWLGISPLSETPVHLTPLVDTSSLQTTLNSTNLMELSARLSSAIAARRPAVSTGLTVNNMASGSSSMSSYLPIAICGEYRSVDHQPDVFAAGKQSSSTEGLAKSIIHKRNSVGPVNDIHSAKATAIDVAQMPQSSECFSDDPVSTAPATLPSIDLNSKTPPSQVLTGPVPDCLPPANTLLNHS